MHLPNGDRAVVPIEKLRDYCLNFQHPVGKHKAKVFAKVLGITANEAERLQEMLLAAAHSQEVQLGEQDEFGQRYILDLTLIGEQGLATIRSSWIILLDEEIPRLVTCYVL